MSVQSPLGTIITASVSAVPEGSNMGLNPRRRRCLAAKRAVTRGDREGYPSGFGPSDGRNWELLYSGETVGSCVGCLYRLV